MHARTLHAREPGDPRGDFGEGPKSGAGSRKAYAGTYQIEFFNGFKSPVATETLVVAETIVLSTVPAPPSRQQ